MSRFADPRATATVDLGPCGCPGSPHDRDEAVLRWQLGASALARIGRAELGGAVERDPMAAYRQTVLETVVSWNLLWLDPIDEEPDRKAVPVPIIPSVIAEMDVDTLRTIAEKADELIQSRGALPNASGGPSPASPRGTASRTPTARVKRGT